MKFDLQRTIVALSSGAMPSARAIIRISGARTSSVLLRLFVGAQDAQLLDTSAPRAAPVTCELHWPQRIEPTTIQATAYYWPDSRSFTGEPSAELHIIGSMPVAEALLARLCALGAAMAHRGEFTLRSFLAGKIDLVQAEAVLGVIEAEGPNQLHEALQHLGGNISRPVRAMRAELIELIAHLEAGLDFAEEDIEFISDQELIRQLQRISQQLTELNTQLSSRDSRTQSTQVVIVGLPNSGKSSLFNRLVQQERAIVSPQAGTTRDVIAQTINLKGVNIELVDTAGIEELQGDTPRVAAQFALHNRLKQADIALFCVDSSKQLELDWLTTQVQALVQLGVSVITVGTKCDLSNKLKSEVQANSLDALVSARSGAGVEKMCSIVLSRIAAHEKEFQSAALQHIAVRCRHSLQAAHATLSNRHQSRPAREWRGTCGIRASHCARRSLSDHRRNSLR